MLGEYLFSALVCISTLIRNSRYSKECAIVILLTRSLFDDDDDENRLQELTKLFDKIAQQIKIDYKNEQKVTVFGGAEDITNYINKYMYPYVSKALGKEFKIFELVTSNKQDSGWQDIEAPWVWYWIHLTTINMDLNCGIDEKVYFIRFLSKIIGCIICRNHYENNKNVLIKGLTQYSLTDLFFQLHTHTKSNSIDVYGSSSSTFILSKKLVQYQYKREFERKFIQLKQFESN